MSNFWGTALGVTAQPVAPARPAVGGYSPSPYFTPAQPSQAPVQAPEAPEGENVPGQWGDVATARKKARSASLTETCPECGSGNYFQPPGMKNYVTQCFDCGWNERMTHPSAGGGVSSDSSAPVRAARQLDSSGASNFHGNVFDPAQGGAGRVG